ncbi:MAG: hypothetical protein AABW54_01950 [Candidatus Micrarchaeota archaeon]
MDESKIANARRRLKILSEELERFGKLVSGHRKMLEAIGSL